MKRVEERKRELDDESKTSMLSGIQETEAEFRKELEKLLSDLKNDLKEIDRKTDIGSDEIGRCIKQLLEDIYRNYSY